jgi:hypothetical protein
MNELVAPSQPPAPRGWDGQSQDQTKAAKDSDPSQTNQRGTEDAPLAVKIVNPADIQPRAAPNPEAGKQDAPPKWWPWPDIWPHPDWALNALTLCLVIIGVLQIWVFGVQASRLKETIRAMKQIDQGQSAKVAETIAQAKRAADEMANSVAEARRSADAMRDVATEMGKSAKATIEAAVATADGARAAWKGAEEAGQSAVAMNNAAAAMGKQALLAHQTYLATHSPWLQIRFIRLLGFKPETPPDAQPIEVEFLVINASETVADITGSSISLEYLYPIDLPYLPDLPQNNLVPLGRYEKGSTRRHRVTSDDWGGLNHVYAAESKKTLYFLGWISYNNEMGTPHRTYYCRRYFPETDDQNASFAPMMNNPDLTGYDG